MATINIGFTQELLKTYQSVLHVYRDRYPDWDEDKLRAYAVAVNIPGCWLKDQLWDRVMEGKVAGVSAELKMCDDKPALFLHYQSR